jgi:hypothetical protein
MWMNCTNFVVWTHTVTKDEHDAEEEEKNRKRYSVNEEGAITGEYLINARAGIQYKVGG